MATLWLNPRDHNTLAWSVSGLSSSWNSSNFQRIVLSSGTTSNGSSSAPSGIIDSLYPPSSGSSTSTPSTEFSHSVSGGNTYYMYAYSLAKNGLWYFVDSTSVTMPDEPPPPKPPAPSWVSVTATATQVNLDWSSVSGATNYEIYCSNGQTIYTYNSNSYYYWNQLLPNTQYGFNVRAYRDGQWSDWSGYTWITTKRERPVNWSWFSSKTAGGNFNITASEWQAFIDRIDAFRVYKGLYSYGFTNPTQGTSFYAYQFNQARTSISDMSPSTSIPSQVSSGDTITAYGLNRLRDSLNSVT